MTRLPARDRAQRLPRRRLLHESLEARQLLAGEGILPPPDVGDTIRTAAELPLQSDGVAEAVEMIGNNEFGPADVDIYRIELERGQGLTGHVNRVDFLHPAAGPPLQLGLFTIRVFDAQGNEVAASHLLPRPADDARIPEQLIEYEAAASGSYYVGVSAFENTEYDPHEAGSGRGVQAAGYQLTLARRGPTDVGDTLATAQTLNVRPELHADVDERLGNNRFGASDVDLYQVRLRSGDTLRAHLLAELQSAPGIAPVSPAGALRIFDESGAELAVVGGELRPEGEPVSDLMLEFIAEADGRYFVGVSSAPNLEYDPLSAGSGLGVGIGHYLMMVHLEPTNLPEDVGDTLRTAEEVSLPSSGATSVTEYVGNGRFGRADVDLFAFKLQAGAAVSATLNHPELDAAGLEGLSDGVLRAFDSNGKQLGISPKMADDDVDFSNITVDFVAAEEGVYYLGVSGRPNWRYDPVVAGSGVAGARGFYLLDILHEPPADGDRAGDTLETAASLPVEPGERLLVEETIGNNRFEARDVDLYAVQLAAGDHFRANLVGSGLPTADDNEPLRGLLRMFDAEGNEVATSLPRPNAGELRRRLLVSVEFKAPDSGVYYVGVSGFPNADYNPHEAGSGLAGSVGHYYLAADVHRQPASDEVGDTIRTAAPVDLSTGRPAQIDEIIGNNAFRATDVDFYRVRLAAGDTLRGVLRDGRLDAAGTTVLEGALRLFSANGTELFPELIRLDNLGLVMEFEAPVDGAYFLGVSGSPNVVYDPFVAGSGVVGSMGRYQLNLATGSPDVEPDERGPARRPRLRAPRFWMAALRANQGTAARGAMLGGAMLGDQQPALDAWRRETLNSQLRVEVAPREASLATADDTESDLFTLLAKDRIAAF